MDYIDLFRRIKAQTGMFLKGESYDEAVAFVLGCDAGNDWCLLHGFREWLVVRYNGPNNLAWSSLVMDAAFPDEPSPDMSSDECNRRAIAVLVDLLVEFLEARRGSNELRVIFAQYSAWLRKQPWYREGNE